MNLLSRIEEIQRKADRHVRTPAGAERYGEPIGALIRRDRHGNILPTLSRVADQRSAADRARQAASKKPAKKPSVGANGRPLGTPDPSIKGTTNLWQEPDEDGYEVVTDGKRKKYYLAQNDDGTWGAWDARDNHIAEGDTHAQLLKDLDAATATNPPKGMHLANADERKKLVVPPDWREVFVADDLESNYVLAKGWDKKGRGQTLYAANYRQKQDALKFARMKKMFKEVGVLDEALKKDAMKDDTAASVLMMRALGMRPGSRKDTGADIPTYGATTLLAKHVTVNGNTTTLKFTPGKKKVEVTIKLKDPFVAQVLSERLKTRKRNTPIFETDEKKTMAYFKKVMGNAKLKQKDLRTLKANEIALQLISNKRGKPKTKAEFRRWRKDVETQVSSVLGNTPTICRSSYIQPACYDKWLSDESWW